ncbi:hypothetical protein FNV43_RR23824 [Rhamnella rubrinervis]|uniref:MADS-box domain-containing protein n=1 Tax=Rhamnella rubrinervis TaxID=2594499 RepID=A0A8K0DKD5_9ROSA|nr:hypothetical protein FNV43_RR23824 [Rhamnella rubrinervis]
MGRGKLKLELITNEKSRKRTFEKRSKGLVKKCSELSTLCDVDVCMVMVDPRHNNHNILSDELIDRYCPSGNSDELLRFMNLLDDRIKEAEKMVNAKKQDQHGHGYQNYASHAPSSSKYINIGHYHHQGIYNNNPTCGRGPVVDNPTVVGMQKNYMMFGNNNSDDEPSSSSGSASMMTRQCYSDQPESLATIMPPYMQYANNIPLQLPGIPFDHHQQQMHGNDDYNDHKGKKVDENGEFLFENN